MGQNFIVATIQKVHDCEHCGCVCGYTCITHFGGPISVQSHMCGDSVSFGVKKQDPIRQILKFYSWKKFSFTHETITYYILLQSGTTVLNGKVVLI